MLVINVNKIDYKMIHYFMQMFTVMELKDSLMM